MKLKRIPALTLVLMLLVSCMGITASAETTEPWADGATPANNQIFYTATAKVEPNGATTYDSSSSTYDSATGKGVMIFKEDLTGIGNAWFKSSSALTGIILPESVASIGGSAFYGCSALTSVSLPEATKIGDRAFRGCNKLTNVSLPKAESIGEYAFYGCSELTSVSLPEATSIGGYAFYGCSKLTSVSLPEATSIGDHAFYSCSALTSVSLPEATSIGGYAFYSCSKLTSVSLPEATSIGGYAFKECTALSSVSLPKATSIGTFAFNNCSNLKYVYTPAAVAGSMDDYSLYGVTTSAAENGTVTLNDVDFEEVEGCQTYLKGGVKYTVTVTPNEGYELDALKYNDGTSDTTIEKDGEGNYIFTMPAKAVTVMATFKEPVKNVAKIGDNNYPSLEAALAAAKSGDTVILLADVDWTETYTSGDWTEIDLSGITLDMDGHTIKAYETAVVFSADTLCTIKNGTFDMVDEGNDSGLYLGYDSAAVQSDFALNNVTVVNGITCDNAVVELTDCNVNTCIIATADTDRSPEGSSAVTIVSGTYGTSEDVIVIGGSSVSIQGGSFTGDPLNRLLGVDAGIVITGGTFDRDVSDYCAEGCVCAANGDGTFSIGEPVAKIGDTGYLSLEAALAAAKAGDTVTLLADADMSERAYEDTLNLNGVTLDLNGKTWITGLFAVAGSNYEIKNGTVAPSADMGANMLYLNVLDTPVAAENIKLTDLTVVGGVWVSNAKNVVVSNCSITADSRDEVFYVDQGSTVTVDGGTYTLVNALPHVRLLNAQDTAVITVKSGTFSAFTEGCMYCISSELPQYGTVVALGGTFNQDVSEICAEHYYCKKVSEGIYTVQVKETLELTLSCKDISSIGTPSPVLTGAPDGADASYSYSYEGGEWTDEYVYSGVGTYAVKAVVAEGDSYLEASAQTTFQVGYACSSVKTVDIQEGTFTLILGGNTVGTVTLEKSSSGWLIKNPDTGLYLRYDGSNVSWSTQSYPWNYDGGFYFTKTTTSGWWIFAKTVRTNYYLTYSEGRGFPVTSAYTPAVFTVSVNNEAHGASKCVDNGDGTHTWYCTDCGENLGTASCEYGDNHVCPDCGHYDPSCAQVNVVIDLYKSYNSNGWIRFWYGKYTYYAVSNVECSGDTVARTEYSLNGSDWYTGSSYSSYSEFSTFYIRVTTAGGQVSVWQYVNGQTVKIA